jgi:tRNA pseudouridine38-40 synthase
VFRSEVLTNGGVEADWAGDPRLIRYEITGEGFLRHMVRTIAGTLVEIGRGRHPVEWMRSVLASRDRQRAGPTAPPTGLVLVSVEYEVEYEKDVRM